MPAALAEEVRLECRLSQEHGRWWINTRLLAPEKVGEILEAIDDPEVGVHVDRLGWYPGLGAWLRWEGMNRIRHFSVWGGLIRTPGLEQILGCGKVAQLQTLNVGGGGDIGHAGLKLLKTTDNLPELRSLVLDANLDYDKTKWNARAVSALLKPTKADPIGANLEGLRYLCLEGWDLDGALDTLCESEVVRGLDTLVAHWFPRPPPAPDPSMPAAVLRAIESQQR